MEKVKDRRVQLFFRKYDYELKEATREEKTAPLLNKLEPLLADPMLLRVFSQKKSSLQFRKIMDGSKIVICKLPSGILGEDASALLGNLIVHLLFEAAMSRQDVIGNLKRGETLPLHMLFMDEFENFTHATGIRQIIRQTRKYKLVPYLGTQTLETLDKADKAVILGSTQTKLWFRVGFEDAELFRRETATNKEARIFQDEATHFAWVRMLKNDDGVERPTGPHKIRAFPPARKQGDEVPRDELIRHSLERYATPRKEVEDNLKKVLGTV